MPAPDPAPGTPAASTPVAPEPAQAPRAARPAALAADGAIAETVARVHPLIVRSLDMSKVGGLDNAALATQLLAFLETEEVDASSLSPLERQRVVTELVHDIKGLGPIEPLLQDAEVSDILINGTSSAYVERKGRLEPVSLAFRDAQHLVHIAQRIAGQIGRRVDESSPDGRREAPRRLAGQHHHPPARARRGVHLDSPLRHARIEPGGHGRARGVVAFDGGDVPHRGEGAAHILISGGTGAGKTTFMNALSREIPDGERLITIEDAAELQLSSRTSFGWRPGP